ncbi:MAG: hypothetical protein AAF762_08755, partial [Pseudomonadota bacterium]
MTVQKAGTAVDYTITWLEMTARPDFRWPHLPPGSTAALLKAEKPPVWYFLTLYQVVGEDYAWEDILTWEHPEIQDWLDKDEKQLFTLL